MSRYILVVENEDNDFNDYMKFLTFVQKYAYEEALDIIYSECINLEDED